MKKPQITLAAVSLAALSLASHSFAQLAIPSDGSDGALIAQAALQALIASEQAHVFGALPANGLKQGNGFDELGLGESALALAQGQVGRQQFGQPQSPKGAEEGQGAGMGTGRLAQRPPVQNERT